VWVGGGGGGGAVDGVEGFAVGVIDGGGLAVDELGDGDVVTRWGVGGGHGPRVGWVGEFDTLIEHHYVHNFQHQWLRGRIDGGSSLASLSTAAGPRAGQPGGDG